MAAVFWGVPLGCLFSCLCSTAGYTIHTYLEHGELCLVKWDGKKGNGNSVTMLASALGSGSNNEAKVHNAFEGEKFWQLTHQRRSGAGGLMQQATNKVSFAGEKL